MRKTHSIKEKIIFVTLDDQLGAQSDTIEVTGDDHIDNLKLYFEGKKSGGSRIKAVECVTKISANVAHVKFKETDGKSLIATIKFQFSPDALAVVGQKKHMMAGKILHVCYAPVPAAKKYENNKLIIKNIPKGMDLTTLVVLIEGMLDLEFEEEFKLEVDDQVDDQLATILLHCSYNDEGEYCNYNYKI